MSSRTRALALALSAVVLMGGVSALLTRASAEAIGSQTVAVTIRHSQFIPAEFTVRQGATIRFVITNTDPIDHEFLLGDGAAQRRHETGTEPAHGALPGEVTVPAGEIAETTYTFTRPGFLLLGCHAPGHYAYGMRGWIKIVEARS